VNWKHGSVDDSTLSSELVDKYKRNGADVWLFDGRSLPRFSRAFEFLDSESSRINVLALNDNPRNTSDHVIEGIAKTGGVFGVPAVDGFMTWSRKDAPKAMTGPFPSRARVPRYVDELDYLKRLVGVDHIGLGPDWVNDLETWSSQIRSSFLPK
jgi:hypothetical protein